MIKSKKQIIVRCPHCNNRIFDVVIPEGIQPNFTVEIKCRHCKATVSFPDQTLFNVKRNINE